MYKINLVDTELNVDRTECFEIVIQFRTLRHIPVKISLCILDIIDKSVTSGVKNIEIGD